MAPVVGLIGLPSFLQMYLSRSELHSHSPVHCIGVAKLLEVGTQRSSEAHFEVFKTGTLGVENSGINEGLLESRIVEFAAGKFRTGKLRIHEPAAGKIARIEPAVSKITCIKKVYLKSTFVKVRHIATNLTKTWFKNRVFDSFESNLWSVIIV